MPRQEVRATETYRNRQIAETQKNMKSQRQTYKDKRKKYKEY